MEAPTEESQHFTGGESPRAASGRASARSASGSVSMGRHPGTMGVAVVSVAARSGRARRAARTIEVGRGHLEHAYGASAVGRTLRIGASLAHGPRHLEARPAALAAKGIARHRG